MLNCSIFKNLVNFDAILKFLENPILKTLENPKTYYINSKISM